MQIPDFHPSVIHFPIALLSLGSVAGLLYMYWKPVTELRVLTWYPLFLGWLGALLAVLTGLLAQSNLPPTAPYRQVLDLHAYTGFGVAILYAAPLYRWWLHGKRQSRASGRQSGHQSGRDLLDEPGAKILLTGAFVLGLALVLLVGATGGQLVFDWGVNVQTGA